MAKNCHDADNGSPIAKESSALGTIAIIGLPNSGKSFLFNKLTHSYSDVANYPQTTTQVFRQSIKLLNRSYTVVDTPGISSLNATNRFEKETRDILLYGKPNMIFYCCDANRLKKNLVLLAQLKGLDIPIIFFINRSKNAIAKGFEINLETLSQKTGLDVIEMEKLEVGKLDEIEEKVASGKSAGNPIKYSNDIEKVLADIINRANGKNLLSRGEYILALEGDTNLKDSFLSLNAERLTKDVIDEIDKTHRWLSPLNIQQSVFNSRESWADSIAEDVSTSVFLGLGGLSHEVARFSRHPVFGWFILLGILWLTFYSVGNIANVMAKYLDTFIFFPLTKMISGFITIPFWNEFFVGNFGIITMGLLNAIVTVIPILLIFFTILNFLEDVGYLPNLSVLTNRTLGRFGLTGKSVLPVTLGFGCNTMATLATRSMETKKERIILSTLIALGVPCSVQLGVMLAILASAPFSALMIVLLSVVVTEIGVGMMMNRLMPASRVSDFIMELPDFNIPKPANIFRKTFIRLKLFLVEATPMFIIAAILMFTLEKTGLLQIIKQLFRPIVTGFLSMPDKVTEVFILVLSRREVGAVYFKNMFDGGEVDYYQTVVGLVVMTLFIPCASNTMVMMKELGIRWAVSINLFIIAVAILVGGIVNQLIRMV